MFQIPHPRFLICDKIPRTVGSTGTIVRWFFKAFVAVFIPTTAFVHADNPARLNLPADEWLRGPARQDFAWKVETREPWLTFQQRIAAQVRIAFRVRELRKREIALEDLHILFRVANSDGQWLPGEAYKHLEPMPNVAPGDEIDAFVTFFAKPGHYKGDLMIYDSSNRRGNVWHGQFDVPSMPDALLADIDRYLPTIQFLSPTATSTSHPGRQMFSTVSFDPSSFGEDGLSLPVANHRPVQIDVLANLALSDATNTRFRQAPDWIYRINADALLQISYVISQLELRTGCIRFSAVDVLRQKIFVDRQDAASVDWETLLREVLELQRNKIEATVLAREAQTAEMLATYMEQLINRSSSCPDETQPPVRVLVVVGDAFIFPHGNDIRSVRPEFSDTRAYHMKLMPVGAPVWDDIQRILKPLRPWRSEFSDSRRFRKSLADLIARIEKLSTPPQAAPSNP